MKSILSIMNYPRPGEVWKRSEHMNYNVVVTSIEEEIVYFRFEDRHHFGNNLSEHVTDFKEQFKFHAFNTLST
jgi:hypothetical protein